MNDESAESETAGIVYACEIHTASAHHFMQLLTEMPRTLGIHHVTVYMNSLGGGVEEAIGCYQFMRQCPLRITTVNIHGMARRGKARQGRGARRPRGSYCQIWCTEGWSCDGPAVLGDLDTVVELHALDHLAELMEAA